MLETLGQAIDSELLAEFHLFASLRSRYWR
jgi:hypothetical protein